MTAVNKLFLHLALQCTVKENFLFNYEKQATLTFFIEQLFAMTILMLKDSIGSTVGSYIT